jgi:hypothetical protein
MGMMINSYALAAPAGGYGGHIGWRVYITANNGDTQYCTLRECQLRTTLGGGSVTSGGTAFQGGPGTDAGNGVNAPWDGNTSNTWARTISGGYGFYFGYLFASPTAIVELAIMASGVRAPTGFKLQYSDDTTTGSDGTWTDAFTAWERSWDTATNVDAYRVWPQDFSGGKYKAFRFHVTANNGDRFFVMTEAELHATVGGSDVTSLTTGGSFGSNNATNAEPYRLWDDSTSFGWNLDSASGEVPGDCAFAFATPTSKPAEYTLFTNNTTARAWNSWKLQGSIDGVTWTDLDTQSGVTWASTPLTKTFAVP